MKNFVYYLVFLGAIIQLLGSITYIRDTFIGLTKPNRVTWLMWSIAPLIASSVAVVNGETWAVLPTFMAGFGPLLIFIASFANKNAYWKLGRIDYLCGITSIIALVLWWITKKASLAIVFSIVSDGIAALPTIIKSWKYPSTETSIIYLAGLICVAFSFVHINDWNFISLAFPIYLIIINMFLFVLTSRLRQTKQISYSNE